MRAVLTAAAISGAAAMAAALLLSACGAKAAEPVPNADTSRGAAVIDGYGCGSCHVIPGIDGANGTVGPPLGGLASRRYLAGQLPNSVDNAVRWIMDPHGISPDTVMPDLGLNEAQARDIVGYLYAH